MQRARPLFGAAGGCFTGNPLVGRPAPAPGARHSTLGAGATASSHARTAISAAACWWLTIVVDAPPIQRRPGQQRVDPSGRPLGAMPRRAGSTHGCCRWWSARHRPLRHRFASPFEPCAGHADRAGTTMAPSTFGRGLPGLDGARAGRVTLGFPTTVRSGDSDIVTLFLEIDPVAGAASADFAIGKMLPVAGLALRLALHKA